MCYQSKLILDLFVGQYILAHQIFSCLYLISRCFHDFSYSLKESVLVLLTSLIRTLPRYPLTCELQ